VAAKAATMMSFCTESTLPLRAVMPMAQSEKNSLARASTLSGCSISDRRVKLRSST